MFLFTQISGIVLPFRLKELYNGSPISKYKLGRLPVVTLIGIIGLFTTLLVFYIDFTVPALGVVSTPSLIFLAMLAVVSIANYFANKVYKRRRGIDIGAAYREIPPE